MGMKKKRSGAGVRKEGVKVCADSDCVRWGKEWVSCPGEDGVRDR